MARGGLTGPVSHSLRADELTQTAEAPQLMESRAIHQRRVYSSCKHEPQLAQPGLLGFLWHRAHGRILANHSPLSDGDTRGVTLAHQNATAMGATLVPPRSLCPVPKAGRLSPQLGAGVRQTSIRKAGSS